MAADSIYQALETCGINWMMRRLTRGNVVILMYHGLISNNEQMDAWTLVTEDSFEQQMAYLSKHCEVVSLQQAIKGNSRSGSRKRAVITFDDGYESNYSLAYPILKKYGFPATIFVATHFVDSGCTFWYDKIIGAVQLSKCSSLDLREWGLSVFDLSQSDLQSRWSDIQAVLTALKSLPGPVREKIAEELLHRISGRAQNVSAFKPLTPSMMAEMHKDGLIEFGSHTHRHELMVQLGQQEIRETLETADRLLRHWLGQNAISFSYPNGDYNPLVKELVEQFGYGCALTTQYSELQPGTDLYAVPRIGVGGYDSNAAFALKVSGFDSLWDSARKRLPV